MKYEPSRLEYEFVCEAIGHLYLERCHYQKGNISNEALCNKLSQKIESLEEEVKSLQKVQKGEKDAE
tara:strand:+ start:94 stop:294 length:201 start_codon:yes stop_codon:yes gene_type:complete